MTCAAVLSKLVEKEQAVMQDLENGLKSKQNAQRQGLGLGLYNEDSVKDQ